MSQRMQTREGIDQQEDHLTSKGAVCSSDEGFFPPVGDQSSLSEEHPCSVVELLCTELTVFLLQPSRIWIRFRTGLCAFLSADKLQRPMACSKMLTQNFSF